MENKKVLLLCYSFPPFPGIGGRRWAKFTKYLSKQNFEVFVIGAEHRMGKQSNWTHDVNDNKRIHYFPIRTRFFSFFHDHNFNFIKKVKYKLSKLYLENRFKGNFYDKVLASNDKFYRKAKELIIKERIDNLVVTIALNRLIEVGIRLKNEFPGLNFVMDIRDPWNICLDDWDHKFLNQERKDFELNTELTAAATADKVFSVYQIVVDFYTQKIPAKKDNFIYVPNGYDSDELKFGSPENKFSGKPYFVYTGILYDISIHLFEEFLLQLREIKKENANDVIDQAEFHFYIPEQQQFKKLVARHELDDTVKFFNQVPLAEIQKVISNAAGCMLFLPPGFEFSLSTKFYEYVAFDKKIMLFSHPGEVAQLIRKHDLGYVMLPGNMKAPLKEGLSEILSGKKLKPHTFNLQDYSIESLTKKIIPFFK